MDLAMLTAGPGVIVVAVSVVIASIVLAINCIFRKKKKKNSDDEENISVKSQESGAENTPNVYDNSIISDESQPNLDTDSGSENKHDINSVNASNISLCSSDTTELKAEMLPKVDLSPGSDSISQASSERNSSSDISDTELKTKVDASSNIVEVHIEMPPQDIIITQASVEKASGSDSPIERRSPDNIEEMSQKEKAPNNIEEISEEKLLVRPVPKRRKAPNVEMLENKSQKDGTMPMRASHVTTMEMKTAISQYYGWLETHEGQEMDRASHGSSTTSEMSDDSDESEVNSKEASYSVNVEDMPEVDNVEVSANSEATPVHEKYVKPRLVTQASFDHSDIVDEDASKAPIEISKYLIENAKTGSQDEIVSTEQETDHTYDDVKPNTKATKVLPEQNKEEHADIYDNASSPSKSESETSSMSEGSASKDENHNVQKVISDSASLSSKSDTELPKEQVNKDKPQSPLKTDIPKSPIPSGVDNPAFFNDEASDEARDAKVRALPKPASAGALSPTVYPSDELTYENVVFMPRTIYKEVADTAKAKVEQQQAKKDKKQDSGQVDGERKIFYI